MKSRINRKLLALILVFLMSLSYIPKANAIIPGEDTVSLFSVSESEPILGNNFIIEQVEVILQGQVIAVKRTTYSDNRMVIEVTENGVTQSATYSCDYNAVRNFLECKLNHSEISTLERYPGFTYEYLKTDIQTYYYSPTAMTYYEIFNELSAAFCSVWWFGAATISTIAAIIAASSSAEVETKIVVTQYWYEETQSGQFISYLCEYVATVYIQNESGAWEYAGVTSGDYNTLYL